MWLPFIVWSSVLNAILSVAVVGPSALSAVYRESSSFEVGLVCTFGFLWGSGTACFSLGIQLVSSRPHPSRARVLLFVFGQSFAVSEAPSRVLKPFLSCLLSLSILVVR